MSAPHEWKASRVGHGEQQCAKCFITNREAAVLGETNGPCPNAKVADEMHTSPTNQVKP